MNSPLTQGNVQMTLVKDRTTKAEVLEIFGPPNISTRDGEGLEVWSYERNAREVRSNQAFANIFLAGKSSSTAAESARSMILIIKFGPDDVVVDYSSRTSSF